MAKSKLDTKVQQLMADVQKRRKQVESLQKPQWVTTSRLSLPGLDMINIQVENELSTLAIAIGVLKRMKSDIEQVNEELESSILCTWKAFPIDSWISDIKQRIKITQVHAEQKKLATLEAQLEPLLSDDQRRSMAIKRIEEALS